MTDYEQIDQKQGERGCFTKIFIGIIFIIFLELMGFFGPKKYEGLTAEEWADEYYAADDDLYETQVELEECQDELDYCENQLIWGF
jgi:hypothetical protein